jgi:hypothetical protein
MVLKRTLAAPGDSAPMLRLTSPARNHVLELTDKFGLRRLDLRSRAAGGKTRGRLNESVWRHAIPRCASRRRASASNSAVRAPTPADMVGCALGPA